MHPRFRYAAAMPAAKADSTRPTPPPKPDWRTLHLWQIQPVRDALVIVLFIGILWLGYRLSIVTVPILLALLLAYLFEPLVRRMTRLGWVSRQGAALAIIVVAIVVFVIPVTFGVGFGVIQGVRLIAAVGDNAATLLESVQPATDPQIQASIDDAATDADRQAAEDKKRKAAEARRAEARQQLHEAWRPASDYLNDLRKQVEHQQQLRRAAQRGVPVTPPGEPLEPASEFDVALYEAVDIAIKWVSNNAQVIVKEVGQRMIGGGAQAIQAVISLFGSIAYLSFTLFLTAFFFFFFSTGWGRVLAFWESLIPERKKSRVFELLTQMDRVIAGFVRGRLLVCAILAGLLTVGYALIGVPAALILGPLVGFLNLVPYLQLIGMPVAMLLMWLEPSGPGWQQQWWWIIGAPMGLNFIIQTIDDYVLTPRIQGKTTGMDTPAIVFASIAGGALAGIYGLLVAIPVAACIKILLREVFWPRFRAWSDGKATDPLPVGAPQAPAPPERPS